MGALVGLGRRRRAAAGLVGVLRAAPGAAARAGPRGRVADLLARAGLGQVASTGFVAALRRSGRSWPLLVVQVVSRHAAGGAWCSALMAGYLPVAVVAGRARRRQREFAEVWPEAVDNLGQRRAGRACRCPRRWPALARARARAAARRRSTAFALDYQVTGRFGECLDRLKDRLADPVGDRVVEGLRIAREVGGGELGRLLRNLSGYLRDDARTRSELESRQAWTVNGARLAVAAPWLVLLFMSLPARGDPPLRLARPASSCSRVGAAACVGRLPADDAHRPAARPSGGSCRDPAAVGCAARRRARGSGCCSWSPGVARAPPAARWRSGCCPTSATCPQVGRAPLPTPASRRRRRGRRGLRARAPGRPPTRSSGCSAAPPRSAAGSSAPASTRPCTSSGSSRCCGGWSASPWPRRTALLRALAGPGGVAVVAAAVRGRRSRSACSPATTTSPRQVTAARAADPGGVPDGRRAARAGGRGGREPGGRARPGRTPQRRRALRRPRAACWPRCAPASRSAPAFDRMAARTGLPLVARFAAGHRRRGRARHPARRRPARPGRRRPRGRPPRADRGRPPARRS